MGPRASIESASSRSSTGNVHYKKSLLVSANIMRDKKENDNTVTNINRLHLIRITQLRYLSISQSHHD
jgi:hypothetical protein